MYICNIKTSQPFFLFFFLSFFPTFLSAVSHKMLNHMDKDRFTDMFEYEVETDFSVKGVPASWASSTDKPAHRFWGDEDHKIEVPFSGEHRGTSAISTISPDGELVAVAGGNLITVYHIESKECRSSFRATLDDCHGLVFAPSLPKEQGDGYQLVSESSEVGGAGGTLLFWDLDKSGRALDVVQPLPAREFAKQSLDAIIPGLSVNYGLSPESPLVEQIHNDYTKALEKLSSGLEVQHLNQLTGHLSSFAGKYFSADGKMLLYIDRNKTTQHGSRPPSELPHIIVYDVASHTQRYALGGHEDAIMWAAFSPDNKTIASASWDGTFRTWDVATGKCTHVIGPTGGQCWSGAWSPDSNHVLFGGMARREEGENGRVSSSTTVAVYSRETGDKVATFEHDRLKHWVRRLAWSSKGDIAIANGTEVWIWRPFENVIVSNFDLKIEERMLRRFAEVEGVWWTGGRLTVQLGDGTTELWDRDDNVKWRLQKPKGTRAPKSVRGVWWTEKYRTLIVLGGDRCLRFWEL